MRDSIGRAAIIVCVAGVAVPITKNEGPINDGECIASAPAMAASLRAHGATVNGPIPGTLVMPGDTGTPPPRWWTVFVRNGGVPHGMLFYIQYAPATKSDSALIGLYSDSVARHAKPARGFRAIWIAVRSLDSAARNMERAGFVVEPATELPTLLNATGREIKTKRGSIWLVQPRTDRGPVATTIAERGPAIFALSLDVANLQTARHVIDAGTHSSVNTQADACGKSFWIGPELTHGVWLQFAEAPLSGPRFSNPRFDRLAGRTSRN